MRNLVIGLIVLRKIPISVFRIDCFEFTVQGQKRLAPSGFLSTIAVHRAPEGGRQKHRRKLLPPVFVLRNPSGLVLNGPQAVWVPGAGPDEAEGPDAPGGPDALPGPDAPPEPDVPGAQDGLPGPDVPGAQDELPEPGVPPAQNAAQVQRPDDSPEPPADAEPEPAALAQPLAWLADPGWDALAPVPAGLDVAAAARAESAGHPD